MRRRLWAARIVLWALKLARLLDPTYDGRLGVLVARDTVRTLRGLGWSVVKLDPATDPGERPIVLERWEDRHAS